MKHINKTKKNSIVKKVFLVVLALFLVFSVNNGIETGYAWALSNFDLQSDENNDVQADDANEDSQTEESSSDESSISVEFNENGNIYTKSLDVKDDEIVLPEPKAMSLVEDEDSDKNFICWMLDGQEYYPGDKFSLPKELSTITFAAKYNDVSNVATGLMMAPTFSLGAPSNANSKFYYNPCNFDRTNPNIPAGKLNGEGTDINNSQLLLSSSIQKAKSKAVATDVCFMDYFKQFNESTSQEIDYDSANFDGQNLYFRVEDSTYVGQLFRFDFKPNTQTQRSYYLNNFNFTTSTSASGEVVGKQVVRFVGGKAKLENITMNENNTIAFELDKYFGTDKSLDSPLELVNAKSNIYLEFDTTNISSLYESYGKAAMPIAKVDAASQDKIKIADKQKEIFDFYIIDGILYVSLKISYPTSNNVFLSASGNNSNDGHNHLCPVQTMSRAMELLTTNNYDNIVLVGTQPLQIVDADQQWIFPETKDKNYFRWNGTYYTKNESGATETHTNTVTKIALAEVWNGKTLTVKNVTTSNIDFHNFVARGGKLILDYVTIKDTIMPLSGDENVRLGAGVFSTNEGSFNSEVTVSNCFFNNLTANYGAIAFIDNYSTFNYESGNRIDKVNYGSSWESSPIFARNKSVVNIDQIEAFDGETNLKNVNSYYLFYIQNGTTCKCAPSFENINNTNLKFFVVQSTWNSARPTVEFADNQYIKNCNISSYTYIDNGGSVTFGEKFLSDTVFTASDFIVMRYNCQLIMKSAEIKNYNANNINCHFIYQDGNSLNEVSFTNVEVHNSQFGTFAYTQNQDTIYVENCKFYNITYKYGIFYNSAYYGSKNVTMKNVEMYKNQSTTSNMPTAIIYLVNDYVPDANYLFDNVKIHDNYGYCGVSLSVFSQTDISKFEYYNNGSTTGPCNWSKSLVEIRRFRSDTVFKQTNMSSCKIYNNNSTMDRGGLEIVNPNGTSASTLTDVEVKDNVAPSSYFSGIQYYCNGASCKGIYFDGVTVTGNKGKYSGVCFNNVYGTEIYDSGVYSTIKNTEIKNNSGYNTSNEWHGFLNQNCAINFDSGNVIDKATNQVLYPNSKYPFSLSAGRVDEHGQPITEDADKWVVDFSLCNSQFLYVGANVFVPSTSVAITGLDDASKYIDTFIYTNLESSVTTYPFDKKIALGKKGVWVDGVHGNNSNDGLSPDTPVQDMNTALGKLGSLRRSDPTFPFAVNVKDKITVANTQTWDGAVEGPGPTNVYRWPYFNGSMISVEQNGDLTLSNLRFVGTDSQVIYACNGGSKYSGCLIEVNKGTLKTGSLLSVWFIDEPGIALYVKSGVVDLRGVTCKNCLDYNGVDALYYNVNYQKATVYIEGDASSNVYLEGFDFTNCDKPNGALSIDNSTCPKIEINKCAFDSCNSSNCGVLSVLDNSSSIVKINNSKFYNSIIGFTKDSRNKENICGTIYNQSRNSDVRIDNCQIYENRRATYVDGAITSYTNENSIVSYDGASSNTSFSKITVTDTNLDFIDVENTKLYVGGNIKPYSGASTSTFRLRQSGDISPIASKLIASNSLSSNNYYKIYINSGYLGEVIVEHDGSLHADKYLENFVVDDACSDYCPGFYGNTNFDVVAKIKHIYLDGLNGENDRSGLSSANAVKDFETAKGKLMAQGAPGATADDEGSCIVICGSVEISEEQKWEFLTKDPSTGELYFENESGKRWQPKLKRDMNGVSGDGSMIVFKSGYASSVNFEMDRFIIDGAHDNANLLFKAEGCNNGFNLKVTESQISNFDYGALYAKTTSSRQGSWASSIDPYKWNIEFDDTSFTDNGKETNQTNLKLINIWGAINFVTNNCLFKDNYFKTSISARNDYIDNPTAADDAYQAPHHMIFKNTDFYNNYGHIYVNSGNYSRNDVNSWDDIQFNGCSYYQDRSLYWTMWNNVNRFFYSRCLYQLNIDGCNFSINPTSSTGNEQFICLETYYRYLNVKNSKFENIENPSGSLIYAYKQWDHSWHGGILFDNLDIKNCFRNNGNLNYGSMFFIRGDGATKDLSNPYDTFEIKDTKIYRDENARYKACSVFRCVNLDLKLTGNTDISGLAHNDGVIVNESTNIYTGPDVRIHDCQRVVYLYKTNSWNMPFVEFHGKFDHNINADFLFYFSSNGNDATYANVVFGDDFIAEYNQTSDTLIYDCAPHMTMNKSQILNNKCRRIFYKQEWYTQRDFTLNGTIIKGNQIFNNDQYGGLISVSYAPKITLNDVIFEDNYTSNGKILYGLLYFNRAAEVYINGGSYQGLTSSNSSTRYYGGFAHIFNKTDRGSATHPWGIFIKDAQFSNFGDVSNLGNSDNRGGFIYNDYGNVEISGSTMIDGCRSYNGGVFYCRGDLYNAEGKLGNIKIYDGVSITDSYATNNGGVYYLENGGQIEVYGSAKINKSRSGNCGGFGYSAGSSAPAIYGSASVVDSSSNRGGCFYAEGSSTVNIRGNSQIKYSTSVNEGGAGYFAVNSNLNVTQNAKITNNSSPTYGGAFYLSSSSIGSANLSGGYIMSNTALYGGAIYSLRPVSIDGVVISGNTTTTEDKFSTDNIHMMNTLSIYSNYELLEDAIFLGDKNYPICQHEPFQASNNYKVTVAGVGKTDTNKAFNKEDVVVTYKNGSLSSVEPYLNFYTLTNQSFNLINGNDAKKGEIILGINVFVNGETGIEGNSGQDPEHAVPSIDKALSLLGTTPGSIYITGTVKYESGNNSISPKEGQVIQRFDGFEVSGKEYSAFKGTMIEICGGTLTLGEHASISGSSVVDCESIIAVDENSTLVLDGASLMLNITKEYGGAIYNKGTVSVKSYSTISSCWAKEGASIYHDGQNLWVDGIDLVIEDEIYLTTTDATNYQTINVVDPNNFYPKTPFVVDVQSPVAPRHIVESSITSKDLDKSQFNLVVGVASVFTLLLDNSSTNVLYLTDQITVYVDPQKSTSGNGFSADNAVKTLKEAYQKIFDSHIVFGRIIIVNCVNITDSNTTMSNSLYSDSTGASVTGFSEISFWRYSKPTASVEGFSKNTNMDSMFKISSGGSLTLNGVNVCGHKYNLDSPDEKLTAPGVSNTKAMFDVQNGGVLNLGTEAQVSLIENSAADKGGAINIQSGGIVNLRHSLIQDTDANNGGGIFCDGNLNAEPLDSTKQNNSFVDIFAYNNGGAIYISDTGKCNLFSNTEMAVSNAAGNAGSSVYNAGELHMKGQQTIENEIFLAQYKYIQIDDFLNNLAKKRWCINLEDPLESTDVVYYYQDASDYIGDFPLHQDVAASFLLACRSGNNTILELQTRFSVYIDGVNGRDTYSGLSPQNAVQTLAQAYTVLKALDTNVLYVVDTVTIKNSATVTNIKYSDDANSITLDVPIMIQRYSKPVSASTLGWSKDSFKGIMFSLVGGDLTFKNVVLDGHSNAVNKGNMANISPGVDATSPMISLADNTSGANSSLSLMSASLLVNNKNVTSGAQGCAVYSDNGIVHMDRTQISNMSTPNGAHGSAIYTNQVVDWSGQSNIENNEIYLCNNEISGVRGAYISLDIDNPNGLNQFGQANKINIDMENTGYSQNRRVIVQYGYSVDFKDDLKNLYVLKQTVPDSSVYTTDSNSKQILILAYFNLKVSALKDGAASYGGWDCSLYDDSDTKIDTLTLNAQGECTFIYPSVKLTDGTYFVEISKAGVSYKTTDAVISDGDLNYELRTYSVKFDKAGHDFDLDDQVVVYGAKASKPANPVVKGYNFINWYSDQKCSPGYEFDFDKTSITGTTIIYSKWQAKTTNITLDVKGGTGGRSSITATYDSPMPTLELYELPTRVGSTTYGFVGYYDKEQYRDGEIHPEQDGNQYINLSGLSAKIWDIDAPTFILYAHWVTPVTCEIKVGSAEPLLEGTIAQALELANSEVGLGKNIVIKLLNNTQEGNLAIQIGRNVTIDLNGWYIDTPNTCECTFATYSSLEIKDTSDSGTGEIKGGSSASGSCIRVWPTPVTSPPPVNLKVSSGTISSDFPVAIESSNNLTSDGITIEIAGGTIKNSKVGIYTKSKFFVTGGLIDCDDNSAIVWKGSAPSSVESTISGGIIVGKIGISSSGSATDVVVNNGCVANVKGGWLSQEVGDKDSQSNWSIRNAIGYQKKQFNAQVAPDDRALWTACAKDMKIIYKAGLNASGADKELQVPLSNPDDPNCYRDCILLSNEAVGIEANYTYEFLGWSTNVSSKIPELQPDDIVQAPVWTGSDWADLVVYAICDYKKSTVTFDLAGGENSPDPVIAQYNHEMPLLSQTPTKEGWTFFGFYDDDYKKYYNISGSSSNTWDKLVDTELKAHWIKSDLSKSFTYGSKLIDIVTDQDSVDGKVYIDNEGTTANGSFSFSVFDGDNLFTYDQTHPNPLGVSTTFTVSDGNFVGETFVTTLYITVNKRYITVYDITCENKTYDGNTKATLILTSAKFTNLVGSDSPKLSNVTGNFLSADAGSAKTVIISYVDYILSDSNYNLDKINSQESTTANIDQREVTVASGIIAGSKTYDGDPTTSLTLTGAVFTNMIDGDEIGITGVTGAFENADAGENKTVNLYYSGAVLSNLNYQLKKTENQPSTTATISKKRAIVSVVSAEDKTYDGSNSATAYLSASTGVTGETFDFSAINATFENKDAGDNKFVTVNSYDYSVIGGSTNKNNYDMVMNTPTTSANINKKEIEIVWGTCEFNYDKTEKLPTATAKAESVIGSEKVNIKTEGAQVDAGTTYTVTASVLYDNEGDDYVKNYVLPASNTTSFTINKIALNTNTTITVSGTYTYTGSEIIPEFTFSDVNSDEWTLDEVKSQFRVDYINNKNTNSDINTPTIKLICNGSTTNYTGEKTCGFTILPYNIGNGLTTNPINLETYTGQHKGWTADKIGLKYGSNVLDVSETGDVTIAWTDDVDATTSEKKAKLIITAVNRNGANYTGSFDHTYDIAKYKDGATDTEAFDITIPGEGEPHKLVFDEQSHAATAALKDTLCNPTGPSCDSTLTQSEMCGTLAIYYQRKLTDGNWGEKTTEAPMHYGTYRVSLGVAGGVNFATVAKESSLELGTFEIVKKDFSSDTLNEVTVDKKSIDFGSYDGTTKASSAFDIKYKDVVLNQNDASGNGEYSYLWSNNVNTTIESEKVTLTITANENSDFSGTKDFIFNLADLKIGQYNNGITDAAAFETTLPQNVTYDRDQHAAQIKLADAYTETLAQDTACGALTWKYQLLDSSDQPVGTASSSAPIDAGKYKVLLTVAGGRNFASVTDIDMGYFTIAKKSIEDVDVTLDVSKIVFESYNGQAQVPNNFSLTYLGLPLVQSTEYAHSWDDNVNASYIDSENPANSYLPELKISADSSANYCGKISVTYDATQRSNFFIPKYNNGVTNIDAFDFTLPGDESYTWVYDANSRDANVKLKDKFTSTMPQDEACGTITVLYSKFNEETGTYDPLTADAPKHAGTYKVYITVSGGKNFGATDSPLEYREDGEETVITIKPSNTYVSSGAEGVDKIYDMTDTATIVSTEAVLKGIYPGDECTIDNVSGTFDAPDVGKDIHISLDYSTCVLSNPDYIYYYDYEGFDHQLDSAATIDRCELTQDMIELDPDEFMYDGLSHSPEVIVRHNDTVLTEDLDYTYEKTDEIYVSTYIVSVTGEGNYCGTVDVEWKITGEYLILQGEHQIYYKGEHNSLLFRCNGAFKDFSYIEIDGVVAPEDVYRAFEGSTYVELNSSFMENQQAGMHTLTFVYDTGGKASVDYEVVELPNAAASWDYNYVYLFMFALIACLGFGLFLFRRKKRN